MTSLIQLSPAAEADFLAHLRYETSIAAGSVLISAEEMAPRLGCTTRHLRALADAKRIPAIKDGRTYRFHLPSVLAGAKK